MNNTTRFTPPVSTQSDSAVDIAIGTIMCIQFILACVENLLVILVTIFKIPLNRRPIHSLILSLASADFLQTFCQQLPSILNRFQHTWTMGNFMCKVYATGRSIFAPAGLLVIALIGVERFRSLDRSDGVAFSVLTTRILIVAVWVVCLGVAMPMATWFDVISYRGGYKRCGYVGTIVTVNTIYTFVTRVMFFLIPIVLTWFCYMGVIYRMMKSSRKVAQLQGNTSGNIKRQHTVIRVSRSCVLIAVVFTVCWTPFNVILMYGTIINDRHVLATLQYAWVPAAFASCINPLIYGLMSKTYRDALLQFFHCQSPTENGSTIPGTTEKETLSHRTG